MRTAAMMLGLVVAASCIALACLLAGALLSPWPVEAADGRTRDSSPSGLTDVAGTLFFTANDGTHGAELWRSDGTASGTRMVKDIRPGRGSSIGNPTALGDLLFFTANDGTHGHELWRSDGTARGTRMVKDIARGKKSAHPASLVVLGGRLLFIADDGKHGRELWRSDGTARGTRMVKDIQPGAATGLESVLGHTGLAVAGDEVWFAANDGPHGHEPWISDGTATGTRLLTDLQAGRSGSLTYRPTVVGDLVLFASNGKLWRSDGSAAGTRLVKRLPAGMASPQPELLTAAGGALYFITYTPSSDVSLWASDGTSAGTKVVRDGYQDVMRFTTALSDLLYFAAHDGTHGYELWRSDATARGTRLVKDIAPGKQSAHPATLVALDDTLLFSADDGKVGEELWRTDGTTAGTRRVKDIRPGTGGSSIDELTGLTAVGDIAYFSATDGVHGQELWRSDGTRTGTTMVKDINAPSPRERCIEAGGTVQVRRAAWATDATSDRWTDMGRSVRLCRLQARVDEAGSRIYVDLVTLASDGPTLAALAYLSRVPPVASAEEADVAARYCADLGGTTSFGHRFPGGWVANDDPDDVVVTLCAFADGSMIDAAALADAARGVIRGADLSALFAYQPGTLPSVFGSIATSGG